MKKALLIIDMQKGSFTEKTPRFNADVVITNINTIAAAFRKSGNHVIFIQHDGTKENQFIPDSTEWELLSSLEVESGDILIDKTANDSFYRSNLGKVLKELDVQELFITDCATDFCVESTIQSALTKDYRIVVVRNGHTTADRPHMSAEQVIEHYNWVWQNMTPTKGDIKLIDAEELAAKVLEDGEQN